MTVQLQNIVIDCADTYKLAQFWSQVTGVPMFPDDEPGDPEAALQMPDGPLLIFCAVPEPKTVKNRMHICLTPSVEGAQDAEVERILGLGGAIVDDRRPEEAHGSWVVMADPEGNEFCVLRQKPRTGPQSS